MPSSYLLSQLEVPDFKSETAFSSTGDVIKVSATYLSAFYPAKHASPMILPYQGVSQAPDTFPVLNVDRVNRSWFR